MLECHKKIRDIYGVGRLQIYVNKNYQVNHKKIYRIIKEIRETFQTSTS